MVERRSNNNQGTKAELAELKAYLIGLKLDIRTRLPKDLTSGEEKLVNGYIRAQLRVARGSKKRARRIFDSLDEKPEFLAFEKRNQPLFAAIDIAIRGATNRKDWNDKPVEPLFTIDKSN